MNEPWETGEKRPQSDEARELEAAYRRFAATQDGERVLSDLLKICGLFTDPFTRDSRTYYNLGRLSVAQHIVMRVGGEKDLGRKAVTFLQTLNHGA
jgi:hypothetical protein